MNQRGYTLIELLIVIAVIGMIAVIGFYALKSTNSSQAVTNAQMQFVTDLRSVQNQVTNGADGINNKLILYYDGNAYYSILDNGGNLIRRVDLPAGVKIRTASYSLYVAAICLANSKMTSYTGTLGQSWCWTCGAGSYFACQSPDGSSYTQLGQSGPASLSICFTNGSSCTNGTVKTVTIEGKETSVNRINPL